MIFLGILGLAGAYCAPNMPVSRLTSIPALPGLDMARFDCIFVSAYYIYG